MKTIIKIFFLSLLLAVGVGNAQTTISGVTMTGVTVSISYDTHYQAWLNRLTALGYTNPTLDCSRIISDMIVSIKADGNWTELDRFWFMAHNGDSDGAIVDMITPTNQATKVNSPGWNAKQGFNSNGTSSYINLNYNPSTNGVKYTLNSASVGVWLFAGYNNTNVFMFGGRSGTVDDFRMVDLGTTVGTFVNNDGTYALFGGTSFSSTASFASQRTSSTNIDAVKNGSIGASATVSSASLPAVSFYACAYNNGGTALYCNSAMKMSVIWIGSSAVNQSEMHSRISTAMTAIALLP